MYFNCQTADKWECGECLMAFLKTHTVTVVFACMQIFTTKQNQQKKPNRKTKTTTTTPNQSADASRALLKRTDVCKVSVLEMSGGGDPDPLCPESVADSGVALQRCFWNTALLLFLHLLSPQGPFCYLRGEELFIESIHSVSLNILNSQGSQIIQPCLHLDPDPHVTPIALAPLMLVGQNALMKPRDSEELFDVLRAKNCAAKL